jgi:uncharacterized membrane protein
MTPAEPRLVLRSVAGICHLILITATAKWCLDLSQALPAIWIVAPIAPLLLAARGLYQDDGRTYQWLGLVLILYVGIGSVEVVASQRASTSAAVVMLTALAEIAVLMSLIRNAPRAPRV